MIGALVILAAWMFFIGVMTLFRVEEEKPVVKLPTKTVVSPEAEELLANPVTNNLGRENIQREVRASTSQVTKATVRADLNVMREQLQKKIATNKGE